MSYNRANNKITKIVSTESKNKILDLSLTNCEFGSNKIKVIIKEDKTNKMNM